jgi:hypothetical protein
MTKLYFSPERLLKQFRLQRFFRGLDDAYAAISPAACSYQNSRPIPSQVGPTAHLASLTNSLENFA